jgi:hypothetical protein
MRGALGSVPLRATMQEHDLTDWRAVDNRAVDLAHYIASHSHAASCSCLTAELAEWPLRSGRRASLRLLVLRVVALTATAARSY